MDAYRDGDQHRLEANVTVHIVVIMISTSIYDTHNLVYDYILGLLLFIHINAYPQDLYASDISVSKPPSTNLIKLT